MKDLMVLPHVQPDPSGTYLQSAGAGVPLLGFDQEMLLDLTSRGFAFSARGRDAVALADAIEALVADDRILREASSRGLDFMSRHTFEADFQARVDHLVEIMRSSS